MAHTGLGLQERKKQHSSNSTSTTTPSSATSDAVCRAFSKHHVKQSSPGTRAAAAAAKQHMADPAVKQICRQLGSAKKETQQYTIGSLLFGGLLFAAGAAAWSLPWLFVLFAVVCLPWRAYSFCKQKWAFYLIDFCYFVNVAAVIYLLWFPHHTGFEALVYALADGPLAGALVAWQCPWVFGSAEHTTSVLMHLLPGLALFAHRYHTPTSLRGLQGLRDIAGQLLAGHNRPTDFGVAPAAGQPKQLLLWLVAAPLVFYITWQLLYFLIVQVLMRGFILAHGYETSYTCLARRAAKTNNIWNRLVRRGSIWRRITVYGLLQLAFTIICCGVFLPTYFSYWLALAYQVVKVAFPVHYGARYQCQKVPQHAFLKGIQQLDAGKNQQQQQHQPQQHELSTAAAAAGDHHHAVLCSGCRVSSVLQHRSCAAEVAAAAPHQPLTPMQPPLVV